MYYIRQDTADMLMTTEKGAAVEKHVVAALWTYMDNNFWKVPYC